MSTHTPRAENGAEGPGGLLLRHAYFQTNERPAFFKDNTPRFGLTAYLLLRTFLLQGRLIPHTTQRTHTNTHTMGAGLAAQRGWPQGQEPTSPHSTEGTTTSSGEEHSASQQERDHGGVGNDLLLYEEVARTEVQPLEDGEYARNYGSSASLTNLVPLDRRQSTLVEENGGEAQAAGSASLLHNDWDSAPGQSEPLEQRDGREMSVAYDLGEVLSTEDEVCISVALYPAGARGRTERSVGPKETAKNSLVMCPEKNTRTGPSTIVPLHDGLSAASRNYTACSVNPPLSHCTAASVPLHTNLSRTLERCTFEIEKCGKMRISSSFSRFYHLSSPPSAPG